LEQFIELAYSTDVNDKREAIEKLNQLEARFIESIVRMSHRRAVLSSRINPLPMGISSLRHILKVELIRAEQDERNGENSALQYACAIAVLK
jgi:hypothetical protein